MKIKSAMIVSKYDKFQLFMRSGVTLWRITIVFTQIFDRVKR
jgi:hypothetical protein